MPLAPPPPPSNPFAHLLNADGNHQVVQARLDAGPGFTKRRRARGAGVGDIHNRDAGLADLLQQPLPDHAGCLAKVAAVQRLHVLDGEAAVVQCQQCRLGTDLRNGLVGESAELDHVYADDICISHGFGFLY